MLMPKSLSLDLRERVVGAIAEGASRRQAAARFGVSVASAIRWQSLVLSEGAPSPKKQGGDQRSHVIEAHSAAILKFLAEKDDVTLDELQERLAKQGIHAGRTTLWRFFKRRKITLKKSRHTRPSKIAPMS
jgi:transposase